VDALWHDTRKGEVEDCITEGEDSSSRRSSSGPHVTKSSGNTLLKMTRRISMRSFESKNLTNGDDTNTGSLVPGENQTTPVAIAASAAIVSKSINSGCRLTTKKEKAVNTRRSE
jgi:hypothetical protein